MCHQNRKKSNDNFHPVEETEVTISRAPHDAPLHFTASTAFSFRISHYTHFVASTSPPRCCVRSVFIQATILHPVSHDGVATFWPLAIFERKITIGSWCLLIIGERKNISISSTGHFEMGLWYNRTFQIHQDLKYLVHIHPPWTEGVMCSPVLYDMVTWRIKSSVISKQCDNVYLSATKSYLFHLIKFLIFSDHNYCNNPV